MSKTANSKHEEDDWVDAPISDDGGENDWVDTTGLGSLGHSVLEQLPALGAAAGGIIGGLAGGVGAIPGAGIGGFTGAAVKNAYNTFKNPKEAPKTNLGYITDPLVEGAGGAVGEAVGQKVIGPAVNLGLKGVGAVAGVAKKGLSKVGDYISKKGAKILSNIPEHFTDEYLKRRGKLNPRSAEEIMDEISQLRRHHLEAIEEAKNSVGKAKEVALQRKEALEAYNQELLHQLEDHRYQTGIHAESNKDAYNAAKGRTKESLQAHNLSGLVPMIQDGIRALKTLVNKESAQSYEILGKQNGTVSLQPLLSELEGGIKSLSLNGTPVTKTDKLAIHGIQEAIDLIKQAGEEVTFKQAKFILQRLGMDTTYTVGEGAYAAAVDAVKQRARKAFDSTIKRMVPEYGKLMERVSENTTLLSEISQKFGTPELALGRLNSIQSIKGRNVDFELLKQLGERTNRDFEKPIQNYLNVKSTLSTPSQLESVYQNLPEYGPHVRTQAEKIRLQDPSVRRSVKERVSKSRQMAQRRKAELEIAEREAELEAKKKAFEPYNKFGQGSVQAKTKALTGARDYDAKTLFGELDQASGKNFSGEIKDRAILDQFKKTDTQGSRKTLLGKAAGAVAGGVVGYAGGEEQGAAAGAAIGFGLDKYSGQIIKLLLDLRIGAGDATQILGKRLGKFAPVIVKAAQSSPHALKSTLGVLNKNPEFQSLISEAKADESKEMDRVNIKDELGADRDSLIRNIDNHRTTDEHDPTLYDIEEEILKKREKQYKNTDPSLYEYREPKKRVR